MIQRIQSIFLFLAGLVTASLLMDPISLITLNTSDLANSATNSVLADGIFHSTDHILLTIMIVLNIIIVIVALFRFKNRPLQITLSRVGIAIAVLFVVLSGFLFYQDYQQIPTGTEITVEYGVISPIVEIILLWLAIRYITKDDKLVRSMDRLR